jgi:hypothetical protein
MYAQLDSPLPGLTVTSTGERCCGMRGSCCGLGYQPGAHALLGMLGDDPVVIDTTSTDPGSSLIPPDTSSVSPIIDLTPPIFSTSDPSALPLPNQISPALESMYPSSVGTEFTSNGDGNYTNIQTGQVVPYSIAEQVTAATTGAATAAVDTTATGQNINITDPNTGATSTINTNNLTTAAQALQAAGQLVNAAGKLTAQGQALLAGGNLYAAPPATGISGAISSLTSWMSGSTLFPGIPNMAVLGIGVVALIAVSSLAGGKKRRR